MTCPTCGNHMQTVTSGVTWCRHDGTLRLTDGLALVPTEYDRLRGINHELVEALAGIVDNDWTGWSSSEVHEVRVARELLARLNKEDR